MATALSSTLAEAFMRNFPRVIRAPAVLVLAVLFMPLDVRASITPEARALVERYLAVVGGGEAFLKERTARVKGTLSAFGLSGSLEQWTVRPDRSASITTIGPFTLREGHDGAVAWKVDQNGKFARRDGKDLEDAKASTWFANEMWLLPDQGGGSVTLVGTEEDSAGIYDVLQIEPPVGRTRRVWFSSRSGLIDREVAKRDVHSATSRQSDYRRTAGRLRAHRTVVEVEGMPLNTATIVIDSVWANPEIDPAVFSPPREVVADRRFLRGNGPARLPFVYASRHVWLKASLNGGPPEDFILDTGASITVIDSAYAATHGIRSEGRLQAAGAGATGGAALSSIDSLRMEGPDGDGVAIGGQKVAVLSLNPFLEPFFWRRVAGVLGYDFISRFVMELDYDGATLVLHDPKTFQYAGVGKSVPMTMTGNIPVVKARIDGQYEGEFRLDVGSGATVDLHGPFVKRHALTEKAGRRFEVVGGGFGGTFTSSVTRMKKMEIGGFSWSDPIVILSGAETGGLASEDYAGNIGNQLLERFKCTFDYERRIVHLEPGSRFQRRDRFSQAGFQLGRLEGRVRAMQVIPGSPAGKAGLRVNDEVLALDGRAIQSYEVEDLRRMFEEGRPGTKHVLQIAREGKKRKKLKLTLEEML